MQTPTLWTRIKASLLWTTMAALAVGSLGAQPNPPRPSYSVTNLVVVGQSEDGATLNITLDYRYDGFAKSRLSLTPIVRKHGQNVNLSWFSMNTVLVESGNGRAAFKIKYLSRRPTVPPVFATDQLVVLVSRMGGSDTVGKVAFPLEVTWGDPNAVAETPSVADAAPEPVVLVEKLEPAGQPAEITEAAPDAAEDRLPAGTFSVGPPAVMAGWQQRFTLGPGDLLNFSLFGQPELTQTDVPIGPDGRVNYLEAEGVVATGQTLDEVRDHLERELAKYRRAPRVIVTPAGFRSKKYFILGRVAQRGSFTLDRPITIIEAVARARGLETGAADRNIVELADLSRTFLARRGERMAVNFEKLFLEGDLTQNIPLEPDDYLYFPAASAKEVYVLGQVKAPGPHPFAAGTTALNAIASRGGFTDTAWKSRVLVVRGSLNRPEPFVVNVMSVLAAREPDFKLQPRDIIYVNNRPWIKAEELLDAAATAFAQSAVITWTGGNIGPLVR